MNINTRELCELTLVLSLPSVAICKIHSINSDGFSDYVVRNKSSKLRTELNYEIEKSLDRKTIIEIAERYPDWVEEYVEEREKDETIAPYDLGKDEKNLYSGLQSDRGQ
ncbi:hypothetical protein JOY44_04515 [Phormidium sp. CLA17]|uniref:hypothetical protein n=1 Tax=Leptolyngbya sp. Cla-17 TaxID=2803751 RepID=UPI001492010C|nr:hypothetical protein [Leptolyngbya sp. Cla-17]MBM0740885.1 hypothetical protein [Leptolyngbya sp. Cla-17]